MLSPLLSENAQLEKQVGEMTYRQENANQIIEQ